MSAIIYSGYSLPVDTTQFYKNVAKRFVSEIELKIRELQNEIELNKKEIEKISKVCPVGSVGYGWVEQKIAQNAIFTAQIEELMLSITQRVQ
jgi:hypothetical protein